MQKYTTHQRGINNRKQLTRTVYETYTRSDISCGLSCCISKQNHWKKSFEGIAEHYIIPTQEVLCNYLPLFQCKNINAIILHSTLVSIERKSRIEYKRIRESIPHQFIFYNDFFSETNNNDSNLFLKNTSNTPFYFINASDCINNNEHERISSAYAYYKKHVNKDIIILTASNITEYPLKYYSAAPSYNNIIDLITRSVKEKTQYVEYYNEDNLKILKNEGRVFRGVLYTNTHNCFSGIVHSQYKGRNVRIRVIGKNEMNRAMNLDGVYVEIVEGAGNVELIDDEVIYKNVPENKSETEGTKEVLKEDPCMIGGETGLTVIDRLFQGTHITDEIFGKVVGIYKRDFRSVVCMIDPRSIFGTGPQYVLALPLDRKLPRVRIRTSRIEELENKRIMVKINEWDCESFYPFGSYVRRIGNVGDEKSEIESILLANGIDYGNYTSTFGIESVMETIRKNIAGHDNKEECIKKSRCDNTDDNLKSRGDVIINDLSQGNIKPDNALRLNNINSEGDILGTETLICGDNELLNELYDCYNKAILHEGANRLDLRGVDVFSIDPPGCTDIDDALHCRLVDGLYEVGIHIADVTFFVEKDSILDQEGLKRGTTVYLTDRRIDMLPTYLSSKLCSLVANEDRLTFSVILYFDSEFNIVSKKYTKAIIRSVKSFTYEEAQNEMQGGTYADNIVLMNKIAKHLKSRRIEQGALELSSSELKITARQRKDEMPEIESVTQKRLHETNSIVEEFMLIANIMVANEIYLNNNDSSLLRRHPKFADDSFDNLSDFLSKRNIQLNTLTSKELNTSISSIDDGAFKEVIKKIITRSMNQAVYFSSGSLPYEEFLHYGLAMPIYTHFTSPIRRYADIIVHRQLEDTLRNKNSYTNDFIQEICQHINYKNRSAMYANLDCDKLFVYLYIKKKEEIFEEGYIVKIRGNGVVIYIPQLGIEDMILIDGYDTEVESFTVGTKELKLYSKVNVKVIVNDEKFFVERRFDISLAEV